MLHLLHFSCKQKKLEQDKEVSSTNLGQTRGQQVVIMKFLWSTERERASHSLCLKSNWERFIKKIESSTNGNSDRNGWIPFGRKLTFRVFSERLSWSRANATCSSACPSPGSAWFIDHYTCTFVSAEAPWRCRSPRFTKILCHATFLLREDGTGLGPSVTPNLRLV